MANAPTIVLPLLLVLFLPAAMSSAMAPGPVGAEETRPQNYIVFISRSDYMYNNSVDYDLRLLASVVGSLAEARKALVYHYSGIGFAARIEPKQADQLSKKQGVSVMKDRPYHYHSEDHYHFGGDD